MVIIHACAHNPTGCDPNQEQWKEIGRIVKEKQLFPLFDAAYLGFNSGNLDNDAFAIRHFVDELQLEVGVCLSFAKNMGLYGSLSPCESHSGPRNLTIPQESESAASSSSRRRTK